MSKYILERDGICLKGNSPFELVTEYNSRVGKFSARFDFDYTNRKLLYSGRKIASWSEEYTNEELSKEFSAKALNMIQNWGWILYRKPE